MSIVVCQPAHAKITKYYYGNGQTSAKQVFINPYDVRKSIPKGKMTFVLNNVIPPASEKFTLSNAYNPSFLTGLDLSSGVQSITTTLGQPQVGNSAIQSEQYKSGLYLNLGQVDKYPFNLPNSSLQLAYLYPIAPSIWRDPSDTMFCTSGVMDLHTSVLGANPNLTNQQIITFLFRDKISGKQFWWNIMLYDSRPTTIPDDFIMKDNPHDTGLPIVITFAKQQNGIGRFIRDVPTYANPMRAYYSGGNKAGAIDVGGCIQRSQFLSVIKAMKSQYSEFTSMSEALETYEMTTFNIAIEIAHNYTTDRSMGMSVHSFAIYSRDDVEQNIPQYGFFYDQAFHMGYVCNVTQSQKNLSGWVDVGGGCYHKAVSELNNFQNQVKQCNTQKAFCNADNKIEYYVCGCSQSFTSPWILNQERHADGGIFKTCYRYVTKNSCVY